ncbi:MAG: DUF1565 domain-containing protein, partial [Polyangiaceae bacterium]|nr:DUF1565 domain-containing protein [Polyangiaceae bacterium]
AGATGGSGGAGATGGSGGAGATGGSGGAGATGGSGGAGATGGSGGAGATGGSGGAGATGGSGGAGATGGSGGAGATGGSGGAGATGGSGGAGAPGGSGGAGATGGSGGAGATGGAGQGGAGGCGSDSDGDGLGDCADPCPLDPDNDVDADGFCADADCAPLDPAVFPGAPEVADGLDADCDGLDIDPLPVGGLYVSVSTGDDTWPGTPQQPFATIAHAVGVAAPGATIFVAEGQYSEAVFTQQSILGGWSTDFTAWSPAVRVTRWTSPDGTSPLTFFDVGGPPVVYAGMTIENATGSAVALYGGQVTVRDVHVTGSAAALAAQSGAVVLFVGGTAQASAAPALLVDSATLTVRASDAVGTIGIEAFNAELHVEDCHATGDEAGIKAWGSPSLLEVHRSTARGVEYGLSSQGSAVVTESDIRASDTTKYPQTIGLFSTLSLVLDRTVVFAEGGTGSTYAAGLRGTATVTNSVFIAGAAPFGSTGVWVHAGGAATVSNSYARGGPASWLSHGINVAAGSSATLVNDVLGWTAGATHPEPVYVGQGASATTVALLVPTASCAVAFGGFPPYNYVCIDTVNADSCAGWPYGCVQTSGFASGDPLFADPLTDWALAPASPARNTGVDPAPWVPPDLADHDLRGAVRPAGGSWDRGPTEQ